MAVVVAGLAVWDLKMTEHAATCWRLALDLLGAVVLLGAALKGFHSHVVLGWAARAAGQKEALITIPSSVRPTNRQYPA